MITAIKFKNYILLDIVPIFHNPHNCHMILICVEENSNIQGYYNFFWMNPGIEFRIIPKADRISGNIQKSMTKSFNNIFGYYYFLLHILHDSEFIGILQVFFFTLKNSFALSSGVTLAKTSSGGSKAAWSSV